MTENQRIWAQSRNELVQAVTSLGYPAELAELMDRELKSSKRRCSEAHWFGCAGSGPYPCAGDSDTHSEADDHFAILHRLLSPCDGCMRNCGNAFRKQESVHGRR